MVSIDLDAWQRCKAQGKNISAICNAALQNAAGSRSNEVKKDLLDQQLMAIDEDAKRIFQATELKKQEIQQEAERLAHDAELTQLEQDRKYEELKNAVLITGGLSMSARVHWSNELGISMDEVDGLVLSILQ